VSPSTLVRDWWSGRRRGIMGAILPAGAAARKRAIEQR
jgi:hypothetical protein